MNDQILEQQRELESDTKDSQQHTSTVEKILFLEFQSGKIDNKLKAVQPKIKFWRLERLATNYF